MKDLKVIFMGTPEFAVPILEELVKNTKVVLVVTQPDRKVGRKQMITYSKVKECALKNNIQVFQPSKIKEDYETILNTPADIIITCAYGQIIPKVLLDYPRLGCINVHASLLPKYRGGAPIHWAIIKGEKNTGITIMYMDEGMDSGDIITSKSIEIKEDDNVGTLHTKLSILGSKLLIDTLPSIIKGTNKRTKQDINEVTYAYNIKRSDEEINFFDSGEDILNKIRGLNPWPLSNFKLNGEEYKILKAYFVPKGNLIPSKIVDASKDKLGISCYDGIIYLEEIKPYGKKVMNIKAYLNGMRKEDLLESKINL